MRVFRRPTTYAIAAAAIVYGAALAYQPSGAEESRDTTKAAPVPAAARQAASADCPRSAWPYVAAKCLVPTGATTPKASVRIVRTRRGADAERVAAPKRLAGGF